MKAIHFKCARDASGGFRNMRYDKAQRVFRSGNWDLSREDATALIGGWLYLHPTKAHPSEFGGVVEGFEPVKDDTVARADRVVLLVRKRPEGTGQSWRGKSHSMAHTSGLVEADLGHEAASG